MRTVRKLAALILAGLVLGHPAGAGAEVGYAPPLRNVARVIAQSGAVVTNTGIGTTEVNMASVAFPPLRANDALEITTLWDTAGVATNSHQLVVRYGTTGCTPLAACTAGTVALSANLNTASLISGQAITIIRNANATSTQNFTSTGSFGVGAVSFATNTGAVQTNAGGFVNIDSITSTASTDTVKLMGYTIKVVPGS